MENKPLPVLSSTGMSRCAGSNSMSSIVDGLFGLTWSRLAAGFLFLSFCFPLLRLHNS